MSSFFKWHRGERHIDWRLIQRRWMTLWSLPSSRYTVSHMFLSLASDTRPTMLQALVNHGPFARPFIAGERIICVLTYPIEIGMTVLRLTNVLTFFVRFQCQKVDITIDLRIGQCINLCGFRVIEDYTRRLSPTVLSVRTPMDRGTLKEVSDVDRNGLGK